METKLFEIRDRATFFPAIAIKMTSDQSGYADVVENWLLGRAGYNNQVPCILFGRADGGPFHYDCYDWNAFVRTCPVAHDYVQKNWDTLKTGDVIDVEFILGETTEKKLSERYYTGTLFEEQSPNAE